MGEDSFRKVITTSTASGDKLDGWTETILEIVESEAPRSKLACDCWRCVTAVIDMLRSRISRCKFERSMSMKVNQCQRICKAN
jgi:hypothetical protein